MSHAGLPNGVLVLINPKAGVSAPLDVVMRSINEHWDHPDSPVSFQFSKNIADGQRKVQQALSNEVKTVIVVGGDGMINSIGAELIHTDVALGVIPTGSGNGFARHFGIPLKAESAAAALAKADRVRIDVGRANQRPFFVTCSMAWDAAIVRTFDKSPVRGVIPYVFAAMFEWFEYKPQPFEAVIDDRDTLRFKDPLLFTLANLTQYGGNARIAPNACPNDGLLELVVVERKDAPAVLANLPRLFNGTMDRVGQVQTRKFSSLRVSRPNPAPIQLDGELVDADTEVVIDLLPEALTVLVPKKVALNAAN